MLTLDDLGRSTTTGWPFLVATVKDFELARSDPPGSLRYSGVARHGSVACEAHGEAQNVDDALTAFSRAGAKRAAASRLG